MTEPIVSGRDCFSMCERELLDLVARRAECNSEALTPPDRIRLLRGLALILAPAEAEMCEITARAIEKAESSQLILREMLTGKGAN